MYFAYKLVHMQKMGLWSGSAHVIWGSCGMPSNSASGHTDSQDFLKVFLEICMSNMGLLISVDSKFLQELLKSIMLEPKVMYYI